MQRQKGLALARQLPDESPIVDSEAYDASPNLSKLGRNTVFYRDKRFDQRV